MRKKNIKLKSIFNNVDNKYIVNKAIERTLTLKSMQLLRQSIFLVDYFLLKNNRFKRKLCLITSRSRATSQITRTTRHVLKNYAINGYLYAFKIKTW